MCSGIGVWWRIVIAVEVVVRLTGTQAGVPVLLGWNWFHKLAGVLSMGSPT